MSDPPLSPSPLSLFLIVSDNKKSKLVIIIMLLISRIKSFGSLLRLWREIWADGGGKGEAKRKRKRREGGKKQKKRKRKPARASKRKREKVAGHRAKFRFSLFHHPFSLSLHRFINGGERVAP